MSGAIDWRWFVTHLCSKPCWLDSRLFINRKAASWLLALYCVFCTGERNSVPKEWCVQTGIWNPKCVQTGICSNWYFKSLVFVIRNLLSYDALKRIALLRCCISLREYRVVNMPLYWDDNHTTSLNDSSRCVTRAFLVVALRFCCAGKDSRPALFSCVSNNYLPTENQASRLHNWISLEAPIIES